MMKDVNSKFLFFLIVVLTYLSQAGCFSTSGQSQPLKQSENNSTNLPATDWFCDERWSASNNIFVGVVKEIKAAKPLTKATKEKSEIKATVDDLNSRLPGYSPKNSIIFQIDKVYKGTVEAKEIEVLNLQTANIAAFDFKIGEKYLLYLGSVTINKNQVLFYYVRPDSRTKIYSESAETIDYLEKNYGRSISNEILGISAKERIYPGIIGGKAVSLPKPKYPEELKEEKASEAVSVYILVDEKGQVIKAKAVCTKYPQFAKAAEAAALASKYSPITVKGKAVKVRGVIVYHFVAD